MLKKSKPSAADNDLDPRTMEEIKRDLLARKDQILKDMKDLADPESGGEPGTQKVKFPNYGEKLDDNAMEIGEYTTNLAREKILESALRDIDNALERMENGTYGVCKYCHQKIGKKRMLARPVASACVECKTRLQNAV